MVNILKKELNMSFDEAVSKVEDTLVKHGFTVLMTKSLDEIFKIKLGIDNHPRYTTILACGAKLAKMAIDASLDVGLVFPCSFVVYEENDKIIVSHASIMKMADELGLASHESMVPVIKTASEYVHLVWDDL
ncbi:MAG: DUF302 domain-containing protein [Asgard group archaeon]|nr:DUF302 domain-containing protein [Asgard group archaeon]